MSTSPYPGQPPAPQGRSTAKVVGFVVAGVVGLVLLLCCGLGAVAVTFGGGSTSTSTAKGESVTSSSSSRPSASSARRPTSTTTHPPRTTTRAVPPSPTAKPTATKKKAPAAAAGTWLVVVGVTDGDTIRVRVGGITERVRVIGIDTPELKGAECYSQQAASKMQSLVQSKRVRLERDPSQDNRDRYDRLLRHVVIPDGRYAAEVLIEGGYGRELTYAGAYAHQADFRAAEQRARSAGRGIWSSGCVNAAPPPPAPAPAPTSGSCVIKGNISSSGEKIYHVPGGGSYADTVITPSKGERWFCSEADAQAAGWRKARN